ncbi:MAG: hypothetical protein ACR2M1_08570 [Gemmatimonadaceae bacterium]
MRRRLGEATWDRSPVAGRPGRSDADAADHPATPSAAEWRWRAVVAVARAWGVVCPGFRRRSGFLAQLSAEPGAFHAQPAELPAVLTLQAARRVGQGAEVLVTELP